jgi:LacI family transcriptional regulator
MLEPTLTSVSQPGFQIGIKATEILLDMIEKKIEPNEINSPIVLKTELIPRKSSQRHP